ncbi:MAG: HEPN domain-containing protein [Chloroflexi bacterium]|nr:MAG: HEPN domain-containing protein [Chloroflexota bacterium]
MSNLRRNNGDDYPEAAWKHLLDAQALLNAARYDGAGYHAGYVIECVYKTLLQIEGVFSRSHNLTHLSNELSGLAGGGGSPRTARYIPNPPVQLTYSTPPQGWKETMRYRAPGDVTPPIARQWVREAQRVYQASIQKMRLDGVIR